MIRNLVFKLPSLRCTSEYAFSSLYRERAFRSLSPVQRLRSDASVVSERSVSCSRVEKGSSVDVTGKPQTRTLCFSKEYYANNKQQEDEVQWRENIPAETEQDKDDSVSYKPDTVQFETLEQYELEAARPRPSKSRDVIEAFETKTRRVDRYIHLQPNQMKPYGSQDNLYSPMLIRPTNSLKYPRKFKKYMNSTRGNSQCVDTHCNDYNSRPHSQRSYSTIAQPQPEESRSLSTTKSCIGKEGHSTKDYSKFRVPKGDPLKFPCPPKMAPYSQLSPAPRQSKTSYETNHWAVQPRHFEFSPPVYQPVPSNLNERVPTPTQMSTPAMRKKRKDEANSLGSGLYRASYSDLIKMKLKEREQNKEGIFLPSENVKVCTSCIAQAQPSKVLDSIKNLPGKRSITTRSKSNIHIQENTPILTPESLQETDQRAFSHKYPFKSKGSKVDECEHPPKYNPKCETICTPVLKTVQKKSRKFPFEPEKCEDETTVVKKIYLPSKVKMAVPPCTPRPEYRDCIPTSKCPERADECLEITPKQLPKLVESPCPCIDTPPPTINPKLERLHFKFEDPPKVVCHPPPCQVPRADDGNPYKYKPLKPYIPQDCPCVEPPPMQEVKLRRLPKCAPEEVCRPVRVCPPPHKCPPRADECYKVVPKKLPPLEGADCPCIDPPPPTVAPPIRRLDLHVPEPERTCPPPEPCAVAKRADDGLKLKPKKLPKFVPGDCPCQDRLMIDWNLRRLVCEDEPEDCVVPDPCKAYPRADWGCWEYSEEACEEVDPKCVEQKVKCAPPKKEKPCRKPNICETAGAGNLDYRNGSKRRFSNASSSSSLKLYQQMKLNTSSTKSQQPSGNKNQASSSQVSMLPSSLSQAKSTAKVKADKRQSSIELIKMLEGLDCKRSNANQLRFKPEKTEKIDYKHILKTIASATAELDKKEMAAKASAAANLTLKKSKQPTLRVASRAISTTESLSKTECEIKKEKNCKAKEKCKNIKPSLRSLVCRKACPKQVTCHDPGVAAENRPGCLYERPPVCCEKEESPYSAFSDNIHRAVPPFTHTKTPQWTCDRPQYGFHPVYKKEHEPLDKSRKKRNRRFSTSTLVAHLPIPGHDVGVNQKETPAIISELKQAPLQRRSNMRFCSPGQAPSKGFLMKTNIPNLTLTPSRPFTTKIFQIKFPEPCKKTKQREECVETAPDTAPKITCMTTETCEAVHKRECCTRDYMPPTKHRKPPPFPAFSDCLDEEMEDILTECPLDKEKYLRMQPRFEHYRTPPLGTPPPSQGKLDLMKEQDCIRAKLGVEKEGVTQSCENFGKPVELMKSKEVLKEENADCKRMEELKKKGRWPPRILKPPQDRPFSTLSIYDIRNFSTFSPDKPTKKKQNDKREFHALTKNPGKPVLEENIDKMKENNRKVFPNLDEVNKNLKMKENQMKAQSLKAYQQLNQQSCVASRVKRFYSTCRWRRSMRHFSSSGSLWRPRDFTKGRRYHKSSKKGSNVPDKLKSAQKRLSKFILNPPTVPRPRRSPKIYNSFSTSKKKGKSITPTFDDLQPSLALLHDPPKGVQEYPAQDHIDRGMGLEYKKRKQDICDEGQTIGCDSFGNFFQKSGNKDCEETPPKIKKKKKSIIEFLVKSHKTAEDVSCCSQTPKVDCEKYEECMSECLKSIPCHLPEEEKYCICQERCKALVEEAACKEKPPECPEKPKEEECAEDKPKKVKVITCTRVPQCPKPCPKIKAPPCKDIMKLKPAPCAAQPCPEPCAVKPSKSLTQLEVLWQKIVNYFKARPNCPEPGDYKRRMLLQKAEKAAQAAGLVAVDPKCLPPEVLETVKNSKKDCKQCPEAKDPCKKANEAAKCGTRSSSPQPNQRKFSTNYQSARSYSSKSCKNLDEINRILEEGEIQKRKLKWGMSNSNMRKEFAVFPERKDLETSEALKMSLDLELRKYVDIAELCYRDGRYSRTYFGYSNIIPSRENILERAWRISIEAYNRYNYPRNYNFFNDLFTKVEKSITSAEDLEKLKTESLLKELDEILKNDDPDPEEKK